MKRAVLTLLAALGVSAALAVTASSTTDQAYAAGMTGLAAVGLVVLLEVINVAGTWTWLTDTRTRVRWEAGVGVGVEPRAGTPAMLRPATDTGGWRAGR